MKDNTTQRRKSLHFPLIMILVGLVFLLERNGLVERQTIFQLMPLVPLFIGASLLVSRLRRAS